MSALSPGSDGLLVGAVVAAQNNSSFALEQEPDGVRTRPGEYRTVGEHWDTGEATSVRATCDTHLCDYPRFVGLGLPPTSRPSCGTKGCCEFAFIGNRKWMLSCEKCGGFPPAR